jgi:hypothetical protein
MMKNISMQWERVLLVAFIGNYLVNNVIAGIASLIPTKAGGGLFTPQYIVYVLLAAVVIGLVTYWYFRGMTATANLHSGLVFGVSGFVVSILTTFTSGVAGVLAQSGSLAQLWSVLPNFGPFLWNWSTLLLFGFWVIPAGIVGWWLAMKTSKTMAPSAPAPMMGGQS